MKREEIAAFYKDLDSYKDKAVTVCGWVRSVRDSKALGFIDLNDGTSFKGVQVVLRMGKSTTSRRLPPRTPARPCG